MTEGIAESSPRRTARMAGVFYLLNILTGMFAQGYVSGRLVVPDAAATFLPRFLGVLAMLGGVGWLAFLYPPLAYRVFPIILAIGLLGAASQILWLMVFGVDEQRWREQASAAGNA